MTADTRQLVDVAVRILHRADGRLLLAQRPIGKAYEGWWEFPGGKLESGESVEQALARELLEELGVHIGPSHPLTVSEFSYPHARVRLHFHQVFDWQGEPHSREGQALTWESPCAIDVAPLLPASLPVIELLCEQSRRRQRPD